jgi:hypothetical protein
MRVIGDTLEEVCSQHKQKWGHGVPLPNPPPPLHVRFLLGTPFRSTEVLVVFSMEDVQFNHLSLNPKCCIIWIMAVFNCVKCFREVQLDDNNL